MYVCDKGVDTRRLYHTHWISYQNKNPVVKTCQLTESGESYISSNICMGFGPHIYLSTYDLGYLHINILQVYMSMWHGLYWSYFIINRPIHEK